MAIENTAQDLADLLATKNFEVKYTDGKGQDTSPEEAKTFAFDWVASSGKNYGTVVVVLGDDNDFMLFFGDNLGRTMEDPQDKEDWFGSDTEMGFLPELKNFATQRRYTFSPKNINQLKHNMQGMAAIREGLFEGYYGNRKVSYMGEQTEARLVIKHNRMIGENDKRYRYVESLFIETADQERFKLPFTKLTGGRAMLEHVRQGGKPYDIRGQHIAEIVSEMAVLSRFNRASQQRVFEGVTQQLIETAQNYYDTLRENLQSLATGRGYRSYFETWTPADICDQSALVEDLKTMFIEQTLDARIEAALPTLAKLQQRGQAMKEAEIFENWANQVMEGTWALPDTPEAQAKLDELMSKELIVGPDATNATEQLYDIIGDDELFDILHRLAENDPRANVWDDTDVQARLAELGIQTPQSTAAEPADVAQDQAPAQGMAKSQLDEIDIDSLNQLAGHAVNTLGQGGANFAAGATGGLVGGAIAGGAKKAVDWYYKQKDKRREQQRQKQQGMAEEMTSGELAAKKIEIPAVMRKKSGDPDWKVTGKDIETSRERTHSSPEGLAALQKRLGIAEQSELRRIAELAQVPVKESVLKDEQRETLTHILDRFKHEVKKFEQGGDLDDDLYHTLYDYYFDMGDMPYGTAKYRTGDPYEWVTQRLADELGITESNSGMIMPEADPISTFEVMSGFDTPMAEGSCNMTAEGEYCPEHGLAECGYMESMGGTVAGSVAPAMDAMDEAMFPGSKIGDKLRSMKQGIGQHADSIKLGLASMPGAAAGASAGAAMGAANLGSAGGSAAALFAPALGTGLLAGAAGALGGFLTYKGLNWLAQKLFGTTEEALEFAKAHLRAAGAGQPSFEFQGKTYPVKIKNEQEIDQLLDKIKTLQMHTTEGSQDPINRNHAITGSYYESRESDALLARIKSLALLK